MLLFRLGLPVVRSTVSVTMFFMAALFWFRGKTAKTSLKHILITLIAESGNALEEDGHFQGSAEDEAVHK
jgi:hypothetical protein